ncbi:MAG: hypothetical protein JW809_17525 [Pirellulales bacterium]|nr:hypothetical protein [Pirellulales bacterium]
MKAVLYVIALVVVLTVLVACEPAVAGQARAVGWSRPAARCERCCYCDWSAWEERCYPYHRDPFGLRQFDRTVPLLPTYEFEPNIHDWRPWLAH